MTRTSAATSGTPVERIAVHHSYDDAGRLTALEHEFGASTTLEPLWAMVDSRAGGEILSETMGPDHSQSFERDVLGQATRLELIADGVQLADLEFVRTSFGAMSEVHDLRDPPATWVQSAAFEYDEAARLTGAWIGGKEWDSGLGAWDSSTSWDYEFAYSYDALQNMTQRTIPTAATGVEVFTGDYVYGGSGPRRLTAVEPVGGGTAKQTFSYDLAGRMTGQVDTDQATGHQQTALVYDPFDRVRKVTLNAESPSTDDYVLEHTYGYDGERVKTTYNSTAKTAHSELEDELRFGPGLVVRGSTLEVVLSMGDRPLARLEMPVSGSGGTVQYTHRTFGAGPSIVTKYDGTLEEERRYSPFGALIESLKTGGAGYTPVPSYTTEPLGWNNKEVERLTRWSDHGARWLAPQMARWTAPDPPMKGPDSNFLVMPWDANPYQYGRQNPIMHWEPDGNNATPTLSVPVRPPPPRPRSAVENGAPYNHAGNLGQREDPKSVSAYGEFLFWKDSRKNRGVVPTVPMRRETYLSAKAKFAAAVRNFVNQKLDAAGAGEPSSAWPKGLVAAGLRRDENGRVTLFHYTNEAGFDAIMSSGVLLPSTGYTNARYGDGQYLTDISPEQITSYRKSQTTKADQAAGGLSKGQVSQRMFGNPYTAFNRGAWTTTSRSM